MNKRLHGFTLVELLIVLAIIGILAAMTYPAITKGISKAQDEKCRTNLKQLHTACVSYANEHGGSFPYAQSFEIFNTRSRRYEERRGWTAWTPSDHDIDTLNSKWAGKEGEKSQSSSLKHDRGHGDDALFGVQNGVIFEYMSESLEHYVCPASAKISYTEKSVNQDKSKVYRTYAMNEFFYGQHYPSAWHNRTITRIGTDESFAYGDGENKKTFTPEASKLLMFAEIIVPSNDSDKGKFNLPRKDIGRQGDSVLVAWNRESSNDDKFDTLLPVHQRRKQGNLNDTGVTDFGFAYTVFVDGHIEQLQSTFNIGTTPQNTLWFLIRGIDPKNTNALGEGIK